MTEIRGIIRKKYETEAALAKQREKQRQSEEALPRYVYGLREAKVALLEYESGGVRAFFDKLSGKHTEKLEELTRAVRQAEAAKEAGTRDAEREKAALAQLEAEYSALPTREELFARYPELEYLRQQDALFAAKSILTLLEENEAHLRQARDWAENRNADYKPLGTQYDKSVSLQKGADCARQICALMDRIGEDGFLVEVHAYFRNPDGYIAGVARQYGQQDRINYALRAIQVTGGIMQELILQLAEE